MILLEGPDGSGKTTLARNLASNLRIEIAPRVVSKEAKALTDLVQWVNQNLREGPQAKIFDRHRLMSEFIYGNALRTRPEPGFTDFPNVLNWQTKLWQEIDPLVVFCLPPLDIVMGNVVEDEDNQVVWEKIPVIYSAYLQLASMSYLYQPDRVLFYDYTMSHNKLPEFFVSEAQLITAIWDYLCEKGLRP